MIIRSGFGAAVLRVLLVGGLVAAGVLCQSCSTGKKGGEEKKAAVAAAPAGAGFVMMEKMLSDQPGRPRTTVKLVIPDAPDAKSVKSALEGALAEVRKQDPSLKAVMFWAYRNRGELNGPNFTLGRLEWSSDGKDFNGTLPLSPNPRVELSSQ